MTTIAYRDGVLAADSLVCRDGLKVGNIRKVGRTKDGHLWAVAGDVRYFEEYAAWMENREGDHPDIADAEATFVWITPDGTVRDTESYGWCKIEAEFHAWGSGAGVALGALAMGATSMKAVSVAGEYDDATGGKTMNVVSLG